MKSVLLIGYLFASIGVFAQQGADRIQFNQIGFYPSSAKIAVVTGHTDAEKFFVISPATHDTVYSSTLYPERQSPFSSTVTRIADFSSLKTKGNYVVAVPGVGNSYSFRIDDNVYEGIAKEVLKGYYFMRSNIPLDEKYAGKWKRPAGHPDTIVYVHGSAATKERPEGTIISTPGGWYDAGDYNKYIVNSGISMGTLLSAYEDFSQYFDTLNTNIPESNDAIPDILNEAIYNLRWMLTMQDPNDGGVYSKCTNAAFDGMVMPGVTKAPRYVVQKSTGATLDFAAIAAQASRILKKFDKQLPGLSDSCLNAAIKAWQWAEKNSATFCSQREINTKFTPPITTGEYGDRSFKDEWLWSAAELYTTTKDRKYSRILEERMKDSVSLQSWGNVALLGYYTFIRNEKELPEVKNIIDAMKDSILKFADAYVVKKGFNVFATVMPMTKRDFVWGSNSVAANEGMLLINVYLFTGKRRYLNGAESNLDYLLGRNATGYCFVTGAGSKSPMHPHHRPSQADDVIEPVPGLLVGGPNPGMQDKCHYLFTETETAYLDDVCAYASNEIAINWNAPLVYLANAIEALHKKQ